MEIIWNESLWFLPSDDGMIIGSDTNVKYKISGNADYYHVCLHIQEKLKQGSMDLSALSTYLSNLLPPAVIKDVVTHLFNLGLIIEKKTPSHIQHPLYKFFTTLTTDPDTAITNFISQKIVVVCYEQLLDKVTSICQEYGLTNIACCVTPKDTINNNSGLKTLFLDHDIIVGAANNVLEQLLLFPILNKLTIEHDKTLLVGCIEGTQLKIGPLIIPGETACYRCITIRKENNLPNLSQYELFKTQIHRINNTQVKVPSPLAQAYLCYALLFDTIKFAAKIQMPATYQHIYEHDTDQHDIESHYMIKVPLCDVCGAHSIKPFSKIWSI